MRPVLHARLQNRHPGLLNLPVPIPSIPVLSPILTPLVEGNNQASSPTPAAPQSASSQPASQPAPLISLPPLPVSLPPLPVSLPTQAPPPPQQPPAPQTPPASNPPSAPLVSLPPLPVSLPPLPVSLPAPKPAPPQGPPASKGPPPSNPNSGGGAGGGSQGNPGGGNPNPGNPASGSNPPGSGNGGSGNPHSGSDSSNSVSPPAVTSASPSTGSSVVPPNAGPSVSPSGVSGPASPASFNGSSGSTLKATSTGVVMPLNNAAASPSSGSTPSNSVQGDLGQSSGASEASPTLLTPAGTNGVPNSGALGSPNAPGGGNGSTSGSGSPGNNHASSSASHSHLSSAAIGGIVAAVVIIGGLLVFILRQRHKRRKAERQVKWINGYVTGQTADMRVTSMRSSWGTPIEHRFSDPFRWSAPHVVNTQESAYDNAESPYPHAPSHSGAPVLPMPVHSPVEDRSYSPENPFADGNASRQPIKPLSSLPLRISLLSTGSDTPDPFDDAHGHIVEDHNSESHISSATFGHGSGLNRDPTLRTQANFPMPPPTAGSSSTGFAIGSPDDLLQLPGILISFPDSPVSPTFAATGTASYPRRASVKLGFHPSQERRDEVQLQQGDQVSVVSVYEDGWAFIQNEKNNDRGLVPLNCLELDNRSSPPSVFYSLR